MKGAVCPSDGFPRLAYLGPGAGWDGVCENFEGSRRSGITMRAQGPWAHEKCQKLLRKSNQKTSRAWALGPGPRPMGLCLWARAHGPWPMGLCPWARAMGPGPWPHWPGPYGPWPSWAHMGHGPYWAWPMGPDPFRPKWAQKSKKISKFLPYPPFPHPLFPTAYL